MPDRHHAFRLRIYSGEDIALGPGRVDLMRHIRAAGSISEAARRMGMSYKRAWSLVKSLNRLFREPLVERTVGGPAGGGARLTPLGEEVLAAWEQACAAAEEAARGPVARLEGMLRGSDGDTDSDADSDAG